MLIRQTLSISYQTDCGIGELHALVIFEPAHQLQSRVCHSGNGAPSCLATGRAYQPLGHGKLTELVPIGLAAHDCQASIDSLANAIKEFEGGVVIVSHDFRESPSCLM